MALFGALVLVNQCSGNPEITETHAEAYVWIGVGPTDFAFEDWGNGSFGGGKITLDASENVGNESIENIIEHRCVRIQPLIKNRC